MPSAPKLRPRWLALLALAAPFAVAALLTAGLWTILLGQKAQDQERTWHEAEVTAANLARAFDEHIVRTVQHIDELLIYLRNEYRRDPQGFPGAQDEIFWRTYGAVLMQIAIIGPDGTLLYSNLGRTTAAVKLGDREHFTVHRDGAGDQLFISKPVFGRVSQRAAIQFTRRITRPDGAFGGVIVLSVDPGYFTHFYETIDVGAGGAITLLGQDRVIRARASRVSLLNDPVGQTVTLDRPYFDPALPDAGTFRTPSALDGLVRIGAYRRLQNFPLIVLVLLAEEEAMAQVEERFSATRSVGALMTGLLFAGALAAAAVLDRERRQREALEKANDELRYLAETDVLTGAKNRRAFNSLAEAELARHRRHGRPLSLVMLDLDHFKAINDSHGHAAGDAVLSEVVRRCRADLRPHDSLGRLGGEEFAVLLPETGPDQAREVAERLRRAIAAVPVAAPEGTIIPVTMSLGVAALAETDRRDAHPLDHLLSRADEALYQAKEEGRNRSVLAREPQAA